MVVEALSRVGKRLHDGSMIIGVLQKQKDVLMSEGVIDRVSGFDALATAMMSASKNSCDHHNYEGTAENIGHVGEHSAAMHTIVSTLHSPEYAARIARNFVGGRRVQNVTKELLQISTTPSLRRRALNIGTKSRQSMLQTDNGKAESSEDASGQDEGRTQLSSTSSALSSFATSKSHHVHWIALLFAKLGVTQGDLGLAQSASSNTADEEDEDGDYSAKPGSLSNSCAGIALLRPTLKAIDLQTRIAGCIATTRCCFQGSIVEFRKVSEIVKRGKVDIDSSDRVLAESVIRIFTYLVPLQVSSI